MSGICGLALSGHNSHVEAAYLLPMVQALRCGVPEEGARVAVGTVGLGAQGFSGRLAGVSHMIQHGLPLALAFHGSVYNAFELLPTEEQTSNPCQGLLRLYVQEGIGFIQRLRGEFACALWDAHQETLYLATDPFRVHPLFYYQDQHKLVFASRMKALLACPLPIQCTINAEAIADVVVRSAIPTPKTIFQEVKKLPPGHILRVRRGAMELTPYWDINFLDPDSAGEGELARKLNVFFSDAVAIRLAREQRPERIGTFLSGGIDSSTVTGVLTQLAKHPIKSFSIGFAEQRFNEIDYARIAAQAFGAEHYEYFVSPKDTYDSIPVLLEGFDEPFGNASAVPTYFCAKMAREQGVEVLYAGDGGDELFAGNERYAEQRLFDYYAQIPGWLRESLLKPLIYTLAERLQWALFVKGKKYIQRASIPYPARLSSYGFSTMVPMPTLLTDELMEAIGQAYDPYAAVNMYYCQAPAQNALDRQLYIDLKLAISDNDLFKVTRMTEAAGITVRYPFLDSRFAEFAATVPAYVKMHGRQLRSFFKRAYADLLPSRIRAKPKHGFGLPIPEWLRTDRALNEMMHDLVLSPQSIQRGYFRRQTLEGLIERHKTDQTSFYGTALWNLMMLELWHRTYAAWCSKP